MEQRQYKLLSICSCYIFYFLALVYLLNIGNLLPFYRLALRTQDTFSLGNLVNVIFTVDIEEISAISDTCLFCCSTLR